MLHGLTRFQVDLQHATGGKGSETTTLQLKQASSGQLAVRHDTRRSLSQIKAE